MITGFGCTRNSGGGGNVFEMIGCGVAGATDEWRTFIESGNRSVCGVDDTDVNRNLFGTT